MKQKNDMKKIYREPQVKTVKIKHRVNLLAGSPDYKDKLGGSGQFAPEFDDDDDWEE